MGLGGLEKVPKAGWINTWGAAGSKEDWINTAHFGAGGGVAQKAWKPEHPLVCSGSDLESFNLSNLEIIFLCFYLFHCEYWVIMRLIPYLIYTPWLHPMQPDPVALHLQSSPQLNKNGKHTQGEMLAFFWSDWENATKQKSTFLYFLYWWFFLLAWHLHPFPWVQLTSCIGAGGVAWWVKGPSPFRPCSWEDLISVAGAGFAGSVCSCQGWSPALLPFAGKIKKTCRGSAACNALQLQWCVVCMHTVVYMHTVCMQGGFLCRHPWWYFSIIKIYLSPPSWSFLHSNGISKPPSLLLAVICGSSWISWRRDAI